MHRRHALLLAALLLCPTLAAAADSTFILDQKYRVSIKTVTALPAGATLEIDVERLAPRNVLGFSRCSEPCDSAKEVGALVGTDDSAKRHASFHVDETGRHYLWLSHMTGENESGPVRVAEFSGDATGFHARYEDGSTLDAHLVLPNPDAGAPPATKGKDRVEIISVSPGSAPRGIESDFTIELEVELSTLSEGIVMVGFNNVAPVRYGMSKTVAISGGPQRLTIHTRAMVVDWQDHGHFGVQVNIGPKTEGMKWIPLADAEREIPALP